MVVQLTDGESMVSCLLDRIMNKDWTICIVKVVIDGSNHTKVEFEEAANSAPEKDRTDKEYQVLVVELRL